MDSSSDVGPVDFEIMKDFMKDVVRDPRMATSSFGVILFADTTREVITLAQNDNLLQRIDDIRYVPPPVGLPRKTHAGLVALQGAFNFASVVLNSIRPKVGILLTNGISDNADETIRQAQSAQDLGIRRFVIGRLSTNIAQQPSQIFELQNIARDTFYVPLLNWSDLRNLGVADQAVRSVCGTFDAPKLWVLRGLNENNKQVFTP